MAVVLTLSLFLLWTTIGLAILNIGRFRGGVRKLLLAPPVGFAILGVTIYLVLRLGFVVRQVAVPIVVVTLVLSLLALWRTRITFPRATAIGKRYLPYATIVMASFLLIGWPLFRYGFDWVANGNDDMANYCIGATGFQAHGYHQIPTVEEITSGQDITKPAFYLYYNAETLTEQRRGSELTLALVSTWTGLTPQQVFMPTILAFNMALISATAGLVLVGTRRRGAALLAAGLLTVSSQTTYGVVQQLIGQASGLALLCTALVMVESPFRRFPYRLIARRAAVCGVVFAGLMVFYPETVPFLASACILLGVRDLIRRYPVRRHLFHSAAAIITMVILLPIYLPGAVRFMLGQTNHGTEAKAHTIEIFPYFMTPRGPALVCGLMPTYAELHDPLLTVSLIVGLVGLFAAVLISVHQFWRGRVFAAVLAVMAALSAMLYSQHAAFGLFKIAMYAQPFLWATVAAWAVSRRQRWVVVAAAVGVLIVGGLNASSQFWYVKQSTGYDSEVDLPAVSQQKVMADFRARVLPRLASGETSCVVIATENNVLAKLWGAELHDVPSTLMTMTPFHRYIPPQDRPAREQFQLSDDPAVRARQMMRLAWDLPTVIDPDTKQPLHELLSTPPNWSGTSPDHILLVAGRGPLSLFNRYQYPESGPALLCVPLSEVRNFAVFRDASGARQNFLGMDEIDHVAMHRLEPDPCFPHRTMAGVGQDLVIDVINPSPRVRVLVSNTSRFRPERDYRPAPGLQIVGDSRVALTTLGDGAARLVSPPIAPQKVGSSNILALHFDNKIIRNPNRLEGFEKLWGTSLPRDRRMLTCSVRDISILSEEEYAAFRPPEAIAKFPDELSHPQLEYSGFDEDGWVNKGFKARLTQSAPGQEVVIRGQVPSLPGQQTFRTEVTVLVDGQPVEKRMLNTGDFEIRGPAGATTGARWIECRFSESLVLPAGDERLVTALIKFVGFEPKDENRSRPPEKLSAFPSDLSHPKLQQTGIFTDGWCGPTFQAQLWHAAPDGEVVIRGQIPDIARDGTFRTEIAILLDGKEIARRTLAPGDFEVRAPAGKTTQAQSIECRFSTPQTLPPPDGRSVGAHLKFFGFEPPRPTP